MSGKTIEISQERWRKHRKFLRRFARKYHSKSRKLAECQRELRAIPSPMRMLCSLVDVISTRRDW